MKLNKKQRRIWLIITIISTAALIIGSLLPLIYAF